MRKEPRASLLKPGIELRTRDIGLHHGVTATPPLNTGHKQKTPRGTLSAFSVNLAVSESSLTGFSSPGRTRTYDKAINSRLLYQLSYRGMVSDEFSGAVSHLHGKQLNRRLNIEARKVAFGFTGCKRVSVLFSFEIASGIRCPAEFAGPNEYYGRKW